MTKKGKLTELYKIISMQPSLESKADALSKRRNGQTAVERPLDETD
jgi:hypothetical protein